MTEVVNPRCCPFFFGWPKLSCAILVNVYLGGVKLLGCPVRPILSGGGDVEVWLAQGGEAPGSRYAVASKEGGGKGWRVPLKKV